jgi:hypothetical protein
MKKKCNLLGVMVRMLASSAVDSGFEPISGPTKDYKIDICCFSAKHTSLRRKNKDWYSASSLKQQSAGRHVAWLDTL